jgi:GT2 family glycosyltransferase
MVLAGDNDVLLLNNDTLVPKGWLEPLLLTLERHPDCGMAMPIQIHKGSSEYKDFNGHLPKLLEHMQAQIVLQSHLDTASRMTDGNWLPLCATIITRKAINKIGMLDEHFLLGGFEDTDYSWRCIDEGFGLYVVAGSSVWHYYGQSFHFHEGYAEKWVETGKYLMQKHNALQTSQGNVYRIKDKPIGYVAP